MKFLKEIIFVLLYAGFLGARTFSVLEFRELPSDFKAQIDPELDNDMNFCTVLRVESTRAIDISLKENVYRTEKFSSGKFYFYISSREKSITLRSPNYEPLILEAPEGNFKPGTVYFLRVDTIDDVEATFHITPADALLRVDGNLWTSPKNKLSLGSHTIEITKEGYEAVYETLSVNPRSNSFNYILTPQKIPQSSIQKEIAQ
ncbi:MAG: hypothetical protein PHE86_06555 [Candidatus Marinimicrobia bacterium]|nr:hypothetical protein [Candidatus Neomarinimicrobiota bacterium]MDD5582869.1 hypothetical protein [Candidatus Neomarinimicrobiota bacterium]